MHTPERRSPQATLPVVLVSDLTAPIVLGLRSPRAFRQLVRDRQIRHAIVKRRMLARLDDVLRALGLADGQVETDPPWNEEEIIAHAARSRNPKRAR